MRTRIPDPNAPATFETSVPHADPSAGEARAALYKHLISLRRHEIVPRLEGARSLDAYAAGQAAVIARWRLGDGTVLTVACNLGADTVVLAPPPGRLLFASQSDSYAGRLPAHCTIAYLGGVRAAHE
jgi:maltooligosyltrehalose trehalohydrolase